MGDGGFGGLVLVMHWWHEGLGSREPVVVVYVFVSSSINARFMPWLTHVEVVFRVSTNSRLYLDVPFPTTVALSESKTWPVVRQCKARNEFSFCLLTAPLCSFILVPNCRSTC